MSDSGPAYTVRAYSDLEGARISSAGKDRVLAALEDHDAVVWLEDWLRSEKPLGTLGGARSLYGCTVKAETDSAWCVEQEDGDEVWVPKSCAEVYERHEDGLATDSDSPQQSLREFARE
ncbi:hypothetical protein M201_gp19 [Haloarcula californiae tailed virus 2]|uniref:Uncharacterized protein n=1 Tax=Haloarcula californiae tailed virus 2 TaxID=1273747 RepID=R4TNJ4_9CAUD|nr:hypothetical protein M201_gp19 [Haloarcula californiae tailed virus 2]AGM11793.1 hypothetical protein HCTV2_19 [Haloarcula californiae tailed virus 2]